MVVEDDRETLAFFALMVCRLRGLSAQMATVVTFRREPIAASSATRGSHDAASLFEFAVALPPPAPHLTSS